MAGMRRFSPEGARIDFAEVNGEVSIVLRYPDGKPFVLITIEVRDEPITAFRIIGNPDKLRYV
jgi:hypothetical protein